jgi:hypothetical protein
MNGMPKNRDGRANTLVASPIRPSCLLGWPTLIVVATAISTACGAPLTKNLADDYGADPGKGDVTAVPQRAVDDLAANPDGGTASADRGRQMDDHRVPAATRSGACRQSSGVG